MFCKVLVNPKSWCLLCQCFNPAFKLTAVYSVKFDSEGQGSFFMQIMINMGRQI